MCNTNNNPVSQLHAVVWWDISLSLFYHSLSLFLYVTVMCIITCVMYTALSTSIGGCYLWSKVLLTVLNECGVLNDGVPATF